MGDRVFISGPPLAGTRPKLASNDMSDAPTLIQPNPADTTSETWKLVPKPAAPKPELKGCLVQIYPTGVGLGELHALPGTPIVIGRAPDCDIRIDDPSVSRRHTCVQPDADGYAAVDLQSTNGTYLDDQRVVMSRMRHGSHLRVGNWIFRFLGGDNVEVQYHEEVYRLTITDGLTGICNKRYLLETLERELSRARRYRRPLGLLLLDLDRFKSINDRLGHLGGDATLRGVVNRVRSALRKEDVLARYGGEEFAVVCPETMRDGALHLAERLRRLVAEAPFYHDDVPIPVTISLGVATTQGERALSPEELIREADRHLYMAKNQGRDRVVG